MPDATDVEVEVSKLQKELTRLNQEQVTKRAAADKLRDDMLASGFDAVKLASGKGTTEERAAFDKLNESYLEADTLTEDITRGQAMLERMYGWTGRTHPAGPAGTHPTGGGPNARSSIGKRVTESDAYKAAQRNAKNPDARLSMDSVPLMSRDEFRAALQPLRARAGLDLASGQAMVSPDLQLIPAVELPVRQIRLLDLINVETTDSDVVLWTKQTQRVRAAAPTPTGTNAPEATFRFERQTSNVKRVPVIMTEPKEVLADEGRIEGILNNQLMADARLEVEDQVLDGDGTGENFEGIMNADGIGSVAQGDVVGEYALDALHRAITFVRLNLFEDPDGIGLYPVDLEIIVLQKDNFGRYIFPPTEDQASIWGFPAVASAVFTPGTGMVGNYRRGATMWLREDVVINATDGYTDVASGINYFSAGLVAVMAQIRAAFAVQRPFAFCEVTNLHNVVAP